MLVRISIVNLSSGFSVDIAGLTRYILGAVVLNMFNAHFYFEHHLSLGEISNRKGCLLRFIQRAIDDNIV